MDQRRHTIPGQISKWIDLERYDTKDEIDDEEEGGGEGGGVEGGEMVVGD